MGVAAYAALVFIVSVIPVEPNVQAPHLDKAVHLCEYLLFAWLLVQAIRRSPLQEREYLFLAWVFATAYGLLIELVQAMIPWRSVDLMDTAANAIGAALGVWLGQHVPPSKQSANREQ